MGSVHSFTIKGDIQPDNSITLALTFLQKVAWRLKIELCDYFFFGFCWFRLALFRLAGLHFISDRFASDKNWQSNKVKLWKFNSSMSWQKTLWSIFRWTFKWPGSWDSWLAKKSDTKDEDDRLFSFPMMKTFFLRRRIWLSTRRLVKHRKEAETLVEHLDYLVYSEREKG